ncbi:MAG: Holliday junction resolvase Hjc [Candidatus Pacearchaeota archaeon]
MNKIKGANAERELLHMLWSNGFACIRVAGSGCIPEPSCDLLAGNGILKTAIECKTSKENKKYFEKKQINNLKKFAENFGLQPLIAIKFNRKGWWFISPDKLEDTGKGFAISLEQIKERGCSFERLIAEH